MCQNDDRIECYGTDDFNAAELFSKLPHLETLNYCFVGCQDGRESVMRGVALHDCRRGVPEEESTND